MTMTVVTVSEKHGIDDSGSVGGSGVRSECASSSPAYPRINAAMLVRMREQS